jgi:hypothetical protein
MKTKSFPLSVRFIPRLGTKNALDPWNIGLRVKPRHPGHENRTEMNRFQDMLARRNLRTIFEVVRRDMLPVVTNESRAKQDNFGAKF